MNREGLISEISRLCGMPRIEAARVVDTIVDSMTAALTRGDKIELRGFGTFRVRSRSARSGRNPKTGAFIHVPPKRVPFFKAGREVKSMLASLTSQRSASATSRPDVVVPEPGQLSPP
jgi:nucleoid DNA-binding protein